MAVGPIPVADTSVSRMQQTTASQGGQIELPIAPPPSGPLFSDIHGSSVGEGYYLKSHDAAATKALKKIDKTPELKKLFDEAVSMYKKKYPGENDDVPAVIRSYLFKAARFAADDADPDGKKPAAAETAANERVAAELKHPNDLVKKAWQFTWLRDPFAK